MLKNTKLSIPRKYKLTVEFIIALNLSVGEKCILLISVI